jgi:hypothetical protein
MATARALLGQAQRITINIGGGSNSPGLIIEDTDTISFFNTAPFPVEIQFICANGPVFNNIARIAPNQSSPAQAPQKTQITTDYLIINLNTGAAQGPYSIEVTINPQTPAPLLIPVVSAAPPANETVVSIPTYGWIQFDFDVAYALTWSSSGVFPSGNYGPGLSPSWQVPPGNEIPTLTYSLNSGLPKGGGPQMKIAKVGGGGVKIRS